MLVYVNDAEYLDGYRLRVEFTDGLVKTIDLAGHLKGEIFEPLKEISLFKQFKVNKDTETIEWFNGADFAPSFLYGL